MAAAPFDYAICGSTPLGALLAGLLAQAGRRIVLVADPWSPFRLTRHFDLSVTPLSRPESWLLLQGSSAETLKLVGGMGKGLIERIDPLFVAETAPTRDFLGHMRWMAAGFGLAAEPVVDRAITETGAICRVRDAALLVASRLEPALAPWLQKAGVTLLPAADTVLALGRNGSATLTQGDGTFEAKTLILADDDAILTHLSAEALPPALLAIPALTVLTEAAKSLGAPLIHYLDREVVVQQRGARGSITAIALGDERSAPARIGATLMAQGRLNRFGQAVFQRLDTADGAPLIGRLGPGGPLLLAGLGMSAAFLAPALARHLLGTASESEARYFAARDPARAEARADVAELPARPLLGAAA